MAYDKVVDSAVLDAGLKQIADAIREKGGTSDTLAFPTAMAEAIAAIEAGGGGATIHTGTFTVAADAKYYTAPLESNAKPKVIFYADLGDGTSDAVGSSPNMSVSCALMSDIFESDPTREKNFGLTLYMNSGLNAYWHPYGTAYYNNSFASYSGEKLRFGSVSNAYYFRAGRTYIYMLIVVE